MIKKVFISGVLGIALLTFPVLTFAEEAEPPVTPAVEEVEAAIPEPVAPEPTEPESPTDDVVTEESREPVTPSAVEDSSIYGNPSMDENLILTSVVGVPDELRVIFSLDGQEVAVVQGNQILACEAFPQDQKIFLQMRIEGQGRLMGARFGFEPFTPVVPEIPILPELPVEAEEMGAVEENTDPAEADNTESETPEAPAEDIIESEENTDPENPVGDEPTEEPTAPDTPESSEPAGENTGDADPGTPGDTGATGDSTGEAPTDTGNNNDSSNNESADSGDTETEE